MTRVWARLILLVCLALTLGPASAVGATRGTLSLNKPPWLVDGSGPTSAGGLPNTGVDLLSLVLTGATLIGVGAALRVGASRARG